MPPDLMISPLRHAEDLAKLMDHLIEFNPIHITQDLQYKFSPGDLSSISDIMMFFGSIDAVVKQLRSVEGVCLDNLADNFPQTELDVLNQIKGFLIAGVDFLNFVVYNEPDHALDAVANTVVEFAPLNGPLLSEEGTHAIGHIKMSLSASVNVQSP